MALIPPPPPTLLVVAQRAELARTPPTQKLLLVVQLSLGALVVDLAAVLEAPTQDKSARMAVYDYQR